jgi:hypothetical protein
MCTGNRMLAVQENFGKIAACDCGAIHVTIGPVSVALDPQTLRKLNDLIGAAVRATDEEQRSQPESFFSHSTHLALKKVMKLKH